MRNIIWLFWIVLLGVGCMDPEVHAQTELEYEGEGGALISFTFNTLSPEVTVDIVPGGTEALFILDTGSPINLADVGHFDETPGLHTRALRGLGLFFPSLYVIFSDWLTDDKPVWGILGSNILKWFDWEINFALRYLSLSTEPIEPEADETAIPFSLLGGGIYQAGDGSLLEVGATRYLVTIAIEGRTAVGLLDSGASHMGMSDLLMHELGMEERPDMGDKLMSTAHGVISVQLTELYSIYFPTDPAHTQVVDTSAVILPDSFFDALRQETGQHVELLIGGSFLRNFRVRCDHARSRFYLTKYTSKLDAQIPSPPMRFPPSLIPAR